MLLLLTACYQQVHTFSCDTSTFEVEDDEVVGDLTVSAADVLAVVEGSFRFDALYEGGGAVSGEVGVARGAGPAIATEAILVEHVSRGELGIGDLLPTEHVECEDALEVPVEVDLGTDDGAVAFSLDGIAIPRSSRPGHAPERFEVQGEVDPADIGAMPEPADAAAEAGLSLQWTAEGFDHVSLWWRGDDYEQVLETD